MLQAWRILRVLDLINVQSGVGFNFDALWYNYSLGSKSSSRVQLRIRPGRKPLVLNLDVNDRGWGYKFFFVERLSLEKGGECSFFLSEWRIESMCLSSLCLFMCLNPLS